MPIVQIRVVADPDTENVGEFLPALGGGEEGMVLMATRDVEGDLLVGGMHVLYVNGVEDALHFLLA